MNSTVLTAPMWAVGEEERRPDFNDETQRAGRASAVNDHRWRGTLERGERVALGDVPELDPE
jgi:hypothetical protein